MQAQLAVAEEELEVLHEKHEQDESMAATVKILKEQGMLKRIPGAVRGQQCWKPVENWEEVE